MTPTEPEKKVEEKKADAPAAAAAPAFEFKQISARGRVKIMGNVYDGEGEFPTLSLVGFKKNQGNWYYECEIIDRGIAQIGWAIVDKVCFLVVYGCRLSDADRR